MNWLVVNLLFYLLVGSRGAQTTDQGFVGVDGDGNLALVSPVGRQLVVDGVALMSELADMRALIQQQQSTIAQLNATVAAQQSTINAQSNQGQSFSSGCVPTNEYTRNQRRQ